MRDSSDPAPHRPIVARHLYEPILAAGHTPTVEIPVPVALEEASGTEQAEADEPTLEPIDHRIARQKITVYAAPQRSAPIRGRISLGSAFAVFQQLEADPACETGWADVGNGGYVCLDATRPAGDERPTIEPPMLGHDGLTPHLYAKVDAGKTARRWRSLAAFVRGDDPIDALEPKHDAAFVARKRQGRDIVLIDGRGRVVLEKEVHRFRPSPFGGRNLALEPVPEGKRLAWVTAWPHAAVRAEPHADAPIVAELAYHDELAFAFEAAETEGGDWLRLDPGGFVPASSLRVWSLPPARPTDVADGELWLDVDLQQQTLTAMVGDTPVYATLISSGFRGPTPRGVFRIRNKQAVGSMASGPGESDFYDVEAVPFVQYIVGGIALHGAYWHDGFGRPLSHGCINLSPVDARHVFSLTTPELPGGWIHAYESEAERGSTIRIRRGDESVADRRADVAPVYGL